MATEGHNTRRDVLKTTGLSLVGLASGTELVRGGEKQETPSEVRRLLGIAEKKLRKKGPDARAKFLRKQGVESTYRGGTVNLPEGVNEDVSANDVECVEPTQDCDGQIEINISIDYFPKYVHHFASLQVRYKYAMEMYDSGYVYYDGPGNPKDGLGLFWNPDEYQITNQDKPAESMTTPQYGSWDNGSWINGKNGTGFRIDDKKVCEESGPAGNMSTKEWSDWDTCGVQLNSGDQYTDSSEVRGEYIYTWNDSNISIGVGASYPTGVSVTVSGSPTVKTEDIGTNLDGESLIVHGREG